MPAHKPYPFAFLSGSIVPIEKANISIMTNALHYGGGVFGGLRTYQTPNGVGIFRLNDHVERLATSCKILRFPYEFDNERVRSHMLSLAKRNRVGNRAYIRPLIYRSDTRLAPDIAGEYDLAIYMLDMPSYVNTQEGLSVGVSSWQRNSDNALPPRTKASGGYLNSALAIHDAKQAGFDTAILLNDHGEIGEGAVMNLFLVKDGRLITPSVETNILEGITRRTIIELAEELGIEINERPILRSELYAADEAFFCGTATELAWCRAIDHVNITDIPGPLTTRLTKAFHALPTTHPEHFDLV